jgi:hypothetical protein
MGQGGEIRRPQAGLTQSLTFHNRPFREQPAMAATGTNATLGNVRFSAGYEAISRSRSAGLGLRSHFPHGVRELRVRGTSRGAAPDHRRSAW